MMHKNYSNVTMIFSHIFALTSKDHSRCECFYFCKGKKVIFNRNPSAYQRIHEQLQRLNETKIIYGN